jgi:hypothetical protein
VKKGDGSSDGEACLAYFRRAVSDPRCAVPWSTWWAENEPVVEQVFSLVDYVRLKYRKLRGAREILIRARELPPDFVPPSALATGYCSECGERVAERTNRSGGGEVPCPTCGVVLVDDVGNEN